MLCLFVSLNFVKAIGTYDEYGFDERGINKMTNTEYDSHGFNKYGIHKETKKTYDKYGFRRDGINILTNTIYDRNGYDINGMNRCGYHIFHNLIYVFFFYR